MVDKARAWPRNSCGELEMKSLFIVAATIVISIHSAHATDLGCVSTTFKALSPNDKVCVSVFEDPQVPGIACHISQARKGGWGQPFGLNEDPSNFSVSCRQIGPIERLVRSDCRGPDRRQGMGAEQVWVQPDA